ncbi:response regulator transcription factor [Bacteroides caecigallinarum]|uniref:LytR/AlgR family response regulator transcription factor n=1 Tax=Bacteroides caecigallinarum TaxID=1411144 RepID=UPI00195D4272|nr:LytTR family DNA-binding domain-containing protein [Bacteroides caecigallinarum]MBM6866107.1 response regulator transcription factor [Bacteroides caecigallinarum]
MTIRCAIIDDEPLALGLLASYVKKTPSLELCGTYSSAIQAMKMLPNNSVDLLFLDIQMPELNGLEFSKMVPEKTRIVFTTAFEQYAIDGYRANALDYLLKPISYADFIEAVGKAVEWFNLKLKAEGEKTNTQTETPDYIYVKSDYKLIQISLDKILYIEGLKDYVKIYTEDNPRPILSLISMKALEEKLPEERFLRVHRSFIVQKQKIKVIDKGRIVFGKEYIPISETYKTLLQDYVNKHII